MNRSHRRGRSPLSCEALEGRQLLSSLGQDLQQLGKDLQTVHAGSNVTQTEIKAVTIDFQSIAAVATKPSAGSVAALEAEVKIVVAQKSITPAEAVVLKKDIAAVLASANIPQSLAKQTAADVEAVIVSSGVTQADVKLIANDVKAILTDLGSLKR